MPSAARTLSLGAALLAAACGSPPAARAPETTAAAADPAPPSPPPVSERSCAELGPADCRSEGTRCAWDGSCRDPVDACELVVPQPSWQGQPVFSEGDPCERVQPGCAWDPGLRRCAPFSPVASCPATLQGAESVTVLCTHSGQAALDCPYGETRCLCFTETYCGGAAPPPTMEPFPAIFVCRPPVDARGCPTGEVQAGAPCHLDPAVTCESCFTAARCVGGRWRVDTPSPRP